jgi:integrase
LVKCAEDDSPTGPNYIKALQEFGKHLRQEEGKGTDSFRVAALANEYRWYLQSKKRKGALRNVNSYLRSFVDRFGGLCVAELVGRHVDEWLDARDSWNDSSKWLACSTLQTVLNWGVKKGWIASNPLRGRIEMPKATPRGRECRLSQEFMDLLEAHACQALKVLLVVMRGTGSRPEELAKATARDFKGDRIVFAFDPPEGGYVHKQAKRGKHVDRVIFLTPELSALVAELCRVHPCGPIFRATRGEGWNTNKRQATWDRLLESEPIAAYMRQHGIKRKNCVPYSYRHTWISDALDKGISIKLIADLAGTSVAMIEKHYGHTDTDNLKAVYLAIMAA